MEQIFATVAELNATSRELFPAWNDAAWGEWSPPKAPPPAIRFGDFSLRLDQVPGGISRDERLKPPGPTTISLPALLPFPNNASLLIQAAGDGRQPAVHVLQAVMLRLLATIPPGKVRFTIIDPVGLGENFAGFMHLADFDDMLVTNRIWTEPQHIEAALGRSDRTHGERDPEVPAERFPDHRRVQRARGRNRRAVPVFGDRQLSGELHAKRRRGGSVSIAASGARCGVYMLMMADTQSAAADAIRFERLRVAQHEPRLGARQVRLEGRPTSASFRSPSIRLRPRNDSRKSCSSSAGTRKDSAPRGSAVRVHRAGRRSTGGRAARRTASTCRSVGRAPRSCNTCSSARAPRSTC